MAIGFLFPGQGSQSPNMLGDYRDRSCVRDLFAQASDLMQKDFWSLVCEGSVEELAQTENTQPLMLLADVAIWHVFQESGLIEKETSIWLAGHSLGEYAALVAAECLDLSEALKLVTYRAQVMQAAVPSSEGLMAAVLGLSGERISDVCQTISTAGHVVEAVNFNSALQTVIAGHKAAVSSAAHELKAAGARKVIFLDLSVPAHTSLMNSASVALEKYCVAVPLKRPRYPIVYNRTAQVCDDPEQIRSLLIQQVNHPVLWDQSLSFMRSQGVSRFVQCGPGEVLISLLRKVQNIDLFSAYDYCSVD